MRLEAARSREAQPLGRFAAEGFPFRRHPPKRPWNVHRGEPWEGLALAHRPGAAKTRSTPTQVAPETRELADAAAAYAGASRAENTKRAYTNDFIMFSTWCEPQGFASMPALPGTVALYLTALAISDRKVATIERALVAICQAHKLHGFPSPRKAPEVTEVLQGIRRTIGVAPNQKDPVLVDTLRALVEPMRRDDPGDVRDRALLCLGFASGCRRSELVGLDVEDLSFGDDGLELTIRRSKTDQEGLGRKVGIPTAGDPAPAPCAPSETGSISPT